MWRWSPCYRQWQHRRLSLNNFKDDKIQATKNPSTLNQNGGVDGLHKMVVNIPYWYDLTCGASGRSRERIALFLADDACNSGASPGVPVYITWWLRGGQRIREDWYSRNGGVRSTVPGGCPADVAVVAVLSPMAAPAVVTE